MAESSGEFPINRSNKFSKAITEYKIQIVWVNVIIIVGLHMMAPYGVYVGFTSAKMYTNMFAFALYPLTLLGIMMGSHRLWSHRSFKANMPLEFILLVLQTMAYQGSALHWARDHRVHHKYSDTDADPHNSERGFFFSQVGWLMCKKHPDVIARGKKIKIDDLLRNRLIMFQHKYFVPLATLGCFIVPTAISVYLWNEQWVNAFLVVVVVRWVGTSVATGLLNSIAHTRGFKPYDESINPTEHEVVALLTCGEGYHNFHHAFPWDYRTGEIGQKLNLSAAVINLCHAIGWTYDLKSVSKDDMLKRIARTGDGSYKIREGDEYDEDYMQCKRTKSARSDNEREY